MNIFSLGFVCVFFLVCKGGASWMGAGRATHGELERRHFVVEFWRFLPFLKRSFFFHPVERFKTAFVRG